MRINQKLYIPVLFFLVLVSGLYSSALLADAMQDRRVAIAATLFPRLVAVDENLLEKIDQSEIVKLSLIYRDDLLKAEKIAEIVTHKVKKIGGKRVVVELIKIDKFPQLKNLNNSGIFISSPVSDLELEGIIKHANQSKIVCFSPFKGDVERGVMAGIFVGAKIWPYINVRSMKSAQVNLKRALIRASKTYE